jgi:hypothetical protein
MHQPVVCAGFLSQPARRDLRKAARNEQTFRRVEESLFVFTAGG